MQNTNPDQRIAAVLDPSERLLWTGQPLPQHQANSHSGGPWTTALALLAGSLVLSVLLSLLLQTFCFIALLVLPVLPFLRRSRTQAGYALTDRRAIISGGGMFGQGVQSFYPGQVVDVQVREHADGSGDVLFATLNSSGTVSIEGLPGFYGIADAQRVENLARSVLLR
jgi:hypothetical protein